MLIKNNMIGALMAVLLVFPGYSQDQNVVDSLKSLLLHKITDREDSAFYMISRLNIFIKITIKP